LPWPVIYAIDHPPGRRPERLRERPPGVPVPVGPRERNMMPLRTTTIRLVLGCLLWAAFAASGGRPAWGMELEGKTAYGWSAYVRNAYAGTCSKVLRKYGDTVEKDEVLAWYRLDPEARDSVAQALDEGALRAKRAEARVLDARLDESRLRLGRLREAVSAGVASAAALEEDEAELGLLEIQRGVVEDEMRDLTSRLAEERARLRDELGGVAVSRGNVPWEIPLRSPEAGVVAEQKIAPGTKLDKKTDCFRVARKSLYVKCRVHAEDYAGLKVGDTGTVSIPQYPGKVFAAVLGILPLIPVDKGLAALSEYEVSFLVQGEDLFVSEGVRVKVVLDK